MTLPTFIICGAPKCGTTALWGYLDEHPDVFMAPHKEPRFFTAVRGELERGRTGNGPARSGHYYRGLDWYESLFRGHAGESAIGEATTAYFAAPDAPELIRRHLTRPRLIFVLRDPVDRLYSHYWQEYRLGWPLPTFGEMVANGHSRLEYYRNVSGYRRHLERYAGLFPADDMLVVLMDDLKSDPAAAVQRIFRFLDVDTNFRPPSLGRRFNAQVLPKHPRLQWLLTRAQQAPSLLRLSPNVRAVLRRFRRMVTRWNSDANRYRPLPASVRQLLVTEFLDDVDFVETWTRRRLDAWRNVSGGRAHSAEAKAGLGHGAYSDREGRVKG